MSTEILPCMAGPGCLTKIMKATTIAMTTNECMTRKEACKELDQCWSLRMISHYSVHVVPVMPAEEFSFTSVV